MEAVLAQQQKELARFSASDRDSWLLAEAGHLLRLANQRLVMAGDPVAAQALLNSADAVLRELDDASLHTVRAAIAADIASLRAVPRVDVEGIYLRLAALLEQADTLVIFQLPEQPAQPTPEAAGRLAGPPATGLCCGSVQAFRLPYYPAAGCAHAGPDGPAMGGPGAAESAHAAGAGPGGALSGNQILYTASLDRAQQWLAQFRESDEVTARAIADRDLAAGGAHCQCSAAGYFPLTAGPG